MADDICTALNLSDEAKCQETATSANGLFCSFHARQCQAMYAGYKKRNARLDEAEAAKPEYLSRSKTSISKDSFDSVNDEKVLNELFAFLFKKRNLLERVIKARKLHHGHFYSLKLDYGHQAYLNKLVNEKATVTKALERLQRRTAEVLYQKQRWFGWVRQCQGEEDSSRENDSQRVKKEAALLKRHWRETETRLKDKRRREDLKRQEAFLEEAYRQRQGQIKDTVMEGGNSDEWDPIDDALEEERSNYVDLMKRLLWLKDEGTLDIQPNDAADIIPQAGRERDPQLETPADTTIAQTRNAKKRAKAKAKAKAKAHAKASDPATKEGSGRQSTTQNLEIDETQEEMRQRLLHGEEFGNTYRANGWYVLSSFRKPTELESRVPGMAPEEVEKILEEVTEIKELLFCRLLLSHSALLPAAIRAKSIPDFLTDPEVSSADLRDVCLRLERPALQEIRDACADLTREESSEDDTKGTTEDDQTDKDRAIDKIRADILPARFKPGKLPENWRSEHERAIEEQVLTRSKIKVGDLDTVFDYGAISDQDRLRSTKVRVSICGKTVWNYASEKTMARGGWLNFSVIAKGSRLEDAISLCRNWQEFWELNCLAMFRYFPSSKWTSWVGGQMQHQQLQLGFIPYLIHGEAADVTTKNQTGSRGQARRMHDQVEAKNVICACIERNHPISRRFVKYLTMEAGQACLLVRDAKTGRVLLQPPGEHLWLLRDKRGIGRASKNSEWNVRVEVNEKMFENLQAKTHRRWQFGFNEYYDLTIWDLLPGEKLESLESFVQRAMVKAHRVRNVHDLYKPVDPVLKSLHREDGTGRVRDARKREKTLYDVLHGEIQQYLFNKTNEESDQSITNDFFYNDHDAVEDLALFPDELSGKPHTAISIIEDPVETFGMGPNMKRFINDIWTDDDSDDYDGYEDTSGFDSTAPSRRGSKATDGGHPEGDLVNKNGSQGDSQCGAERGKRQHHHENNDALVMGAEELENMFEDKTLIRRIQDFIGHESVRDREPDMEADFHTFVERERSKVYKSVWHPVDFDEEAGQRWAEAAQLNTEARHLRNGELSTHGFCIELLMWLNVHPHENRLVERDVLSISASIALFFPDQAAANSGIRSWLSSLPERTKLVDNTFKARAAPYIRNFRSNHTLPTNFFDRAREQVGAGRDYCPTEWKLKLRPMIAKLYMHGIITPAYIPFTAGHAVWTADPGSDANLYIDYRWAEKGYYGAGASDDYRRVNLLRTARKWSQDHENARFALFRIWTHSHFYPLPISSETRDLFSFTDTQERSWHFKFLPKDSWYSEWSMHMSVGQRLARWQRILGPRYEVKRDMVLVMGVGEADLHRYATAVAFGLQTNPWRLEIDLWKSFVNVDLAFLEGLDDAWLE